MADPDNKCEDCFAPVKLGEMLCAGCIAERRNMVGDYEDDDEGFSEEQEAELNCSMGPDGQCGQAGSEYCDLECPYRD